MDVPGYLRLFPPDDAPPDAADPHRLAAQELLRPPADGPGGRALEPFSRAWFEELEFKRYARQGAWLPRVLEFTRHGGETLLMLGPGLGSDALQYQRHGTRVTVLAGPDDRPDLVRRNYDQRGLEVKIVPAPEQWAAAVGSRQTGLQLPSANCRCPLPFPRGAFDLAYVNALHAAPADPAALAADLYRVLKPGGKVFALFPARYDADFWSGWLVPLRRWLWKRPAAPTAGPRASGAELRSVFARFDQHRVCKRHLRRSELPPPWRFLPLPLLERLLGRVLVLKAFKPLRAAKEELAEAA